MTVWKKYSCEASCADFMTVSDVRRSVRGHAQNCYFPFGNQPRRPKSSEASVFVDWRISSSFRQFIFCYKHGFKFPHSCTFVLLTLVFMHHYRLFPPFSPISSFVTRLLIETDLTSWASEDNEDGHTKTFVICINLKLCQRRRETCLCCLPVTLCCTSLITNQRFFGCTTWGN